MLHGLSLVLLTLALFGAAAFFALCRFPLRCACGDGSVQAATRNGLESVERRCLAICHKHGGGAPLKAADKPDR
jgi:hypothetical protein